MLNKVIKEAIREQKHFLASIEGLSCTFWACDGTPENNRIRTMITCSRCQAIINTNRSIKKLQKLLPENLVVSK